MRSSGRTTPSSSAAAARITLKVEPGLGRLQHVRRGDLAPERVAADDRLSGRARELSVEDALNTLEPALDPLEPDDVRRQLAVRVEAEGLGQEAESGLAQRPDRGGDCGRELPPEPDERTRARQSRVHLRGRQANDRRQPRGAAAGVARPVPPATYSRASRI